MNLFSLIQVHTIFFIFEHTLYTSFEVRNTLWVGALE